MEIKIQCDCGQRYKLDVEPANGVMPFPVACPICGADGTQKGTDLIQQAIAASPGAAETPVAVPGRLKLSLDRPAPPPLSPTASEPESAPVAATSPGRIGAMAKPVPAADAGRKPNFGLGLLGGFAGALAGAFLYYLIVKVTGLRISYFAIGVGALSGWMANLLGRGEGSKELAGITAVLTVAFIIGAQYFITLSVWHAVLGSTFDQPAYDRDVKQAQEAVKLVPTGSDIEIRTYLAREVADAESKPDPASVSDEDVKQFHDVLLPAYRDLADGKVTREQYNAQRGIDLAKEKKRSEDAEGTFKAFFILRLIRWGNIISLIAAAGLAFRLSANA